jgi:hypothetical protein
MATPDTLRGARPDTSAVRRGMLGDAVVDASNTRRYRLAHRLRTTRAEGM